MLISAFDKTMSRFVTFGLAGIIISPLNTLESIRKVLIKYTKYTKITNTGVNPVGLSHSIQEVAPKKLVDNKRKTIIS